jgi:hypothetical protein
MTDFKPMMEHALEYVSQGFKIIPLERRGKIPLTEKGLKDFTETQGQPLPPAVRIPSVPRYGNRTTQLRFIQRKAKSSINYITCSPKFEANRALEII